MLELVNWSEKRTISVTVQYLSKCLMQGYFMAEGSEVKEYRVQIRENQEWLIHLKCCPWMKCLPLT